jgi:two-component system, NarL family, invasion response regulator UvrY
VRVDPGWDNRREMDPARTVLIVDDQAPFRAVARTVVSMTPGFDVAGEAESGEEAVTEAVRLQPDVVLMDINMGGISGIEATRRILATQPGILVVLLSTYDEQDLPDEARTCGAARYVHKEDFEPGILMDLLPRTPAG